MVFKDSGYRIPLLKNCGWCGKAETPAYLIGFEQVCAECAAPIIAEREAALAALADYLTPEREDAPVSTPEGG